MKHSLLLALVCACLSLASCTGTQAEQQAQLSRLANIAVTALVATNPDKAVLIQQGGALVLKAVNGDGIKAEDASNLAVEVAVDQGKLTREEADLLKAAGTVPLSPVNPLLPAPGASTAVALTASK